MILLGNKYSWQIFKSF